MLTACQFLFYMGLSVDLTLTVIVGLKLAPSPALATLPLSVMTVVAMLSNFSAGLLSTRFGHRKVLIAGALLATVGGLVSMRAISIGNFYLLCLGTAIVGAYKATGGYFRYLAADCALPGRRERAVSTVLLGGVAAAILGPLVATACAGLFEVEYMGAYLLVSVLAAGVIPLVLLVRDRAPVPPSVDTPPPSERIAAVPFTVAALTSSFRSGFVILAVAGCVMTLLMATAPLGSMHVGHSMAQGALIIQWHLVGMFAPSLFSGRLTTSLGARYTAVLGSAILVCGGLLGASGTGMAAFMVSLGLIGVGWNIMYVAGSAYVVRSYPPGAGGHVQAAVEGGTGVFITLISFSSSLLYQQLGWQTLCLLASVPGLLLCFWLLFRPQDRQEAQ